MLELVNLRTEELEVVEKQNIIKIEFDSSIRGVVFYTKDEKYKIPNTVDFWSEILYKDDFRSTDKTNLINMNQVESVDENGNVKFYDNKDMIGSAAKMHLGYVEYAVKMLRTGKRLEEIDYEYYRQQRGFKSFKKLVGSIFKNREISFQNNIKPDEL